MTKLLLLLPLAVLSVVASIVWFLRAYTRFMARRVYGEQSVPAEFSVVEGDRVT